MYKVLRGVCLTVVASVVIGCGPKPFDDDPFAIWPTGDSRLNQAGQRLSSLTGPVAADAAANIADIQVPADSGADDYVKLALERNPAIRAALQKVARLGERVPQATSLDDPMFQVAPVGEMAETAAGQVRLMAGVSQRLPTPGKLGARGRIASQDAAVAVQEFHDTRLRVVADTRRAFWSYYFTTRAIEVTQANRNLLAQFHQIAEAKYKANTASQQDVLRASVELSNVDNELITLDQQQTTSVAMLNRLIDRPVIAPLPQPRAVDHDTLGLDLDHLLTEAARSSPLIQKVREQIQGFRERLALAKLNRWPDLTVSANYAAVDDDGLSGVSNGDDQWWLGFGINLPVWTQRLDAAEQEATRGIFEGIAQLTDTHNRVAFQVQDAFVRVDTDRRLTILFRDVIVPQARQTVDASLNDYQAGGVDFLTLIDSWRKLLDFELMYHQSLARLEQDFATLEKVVGHDLNRQPGTPDSVPEVLPNTRDREPQPH